MTKTEKNTIKLCIKALEVELSNNPAALILLETINILVIKEVE